jgi:hypothetical protein
MWYEIGSLRLSEPHVMLQGTRTSGRIAGNGLRLVLIDGSVVDSRPEVRYI